MIVYISGGCKNGKSSYAQRIAVKLAESNPLYYIATMIPKDVEDMQRISRHIKDREGMGFETIECGTNLPSCLSVAKSCGTFLLDSVTALLANEMFHEKNEPDFSAIKSCEKDILTFISKVKNAVIVSDYIFSDAIEFDSITEKYREGLAYIDRSVVKKSDVLIELCAGNIIIHKGNIQL